ncbi:U2 snRNP complex subunit CUS2 [Sporobolomyces salmoneus]|uniref:U2 snRNP complex subunit CUS2 n=1 Tax=Sporobolomyces salmoneus TaxID=183962 RepID=UPI0031800ADD
MSTPHQPIASTSQAPAMTANSAGGATNGNQSEPYFDTTSQKWMVETPDGAELEWDDQRKAWVPIVDEDLMKKQQAAYSVQGVDETEEIIPLSKEERKQASKKRKAPSSEKPSTNTSIFVSSLPLSPPPSISLLSSLFSKAGLILLDPITSQPRIKLYHDPTSGQFKGEALIVYLQKESVELAKRLFDQTELELGSGKGLINVQEAKWTPKEKTEGGDGEGQGKEKRKKTDEEKKSEERAKRLGKKAAAQRQKLQDWDSSDEESSSSATAKKFKGVVVLEGMFTLSELEEDATLLLDLKEDVREECETLGTVTNVTLYDKEDRGIMTVRFREELSAKACIAKMNGRFFAGRTIQAYPMNGKHKFSKSGKGDDLLEGTGLESTEGDTGGGGGEAEKEKERLKAYAEWLEKGGE